MSNISKEARTFNVKYLWIKKRKELDVSIALRALDLVDANDPIRFRLEKIVSDVDAKYSPDLSGRWHFPSEVLRKATKRASDFEAKWKAAGEPNLRLLTLRPRPIASINEPLSQYCARISEQLSRTLDYIKRENFATPIVSMMHIDITDEESGHLPDPHFHLIWDIEEKNIEIVRKYLEKKYSDVWFDKSKVESPRNAAFYIYACITDFELLPQISDDKFKQIWNVTKVRFYRPAGWLLNTDNPTFAESEACDQDDGQVDPPLEPNPEREASIAPDTSNDTVRIPPPESKKTSAATMDPSLSPTIEQFIFVTRILRARVAEGDKFSFLYECELYNCTHQQGMDAIRKVYSYFRVNIFFPGPITGMEFEPTQDGIDFMIRCSPVADQIEEAFEFFSKPAYDASPRQLAARGYPTLIDSSSV